MSIYSRQYFRSIGKSLHHQFKNHQNKPGVIAVLMKGRIDLDMLGRNITNLFIAIIEYNKKVIECISYSIRHSFTCHIVLTVVGFVRTMLKSIVSHKSKIKELGIKYVLF